MLLGRSDIGRWLPCGLAVLLALGPEAVAVHAAVPARQALNTVAHEARVSLRIVDLQGRTAATLVDGLQGAGRYQMGIVTAAAIMGSHVRVGLEDSLYLGRGQIAESNAGQVTKIRGILEALSLEIATPAEARQLLGLKGLENVGY